MNKNRDRILVPDGYVQPPINDGEVVECPDCNGYGFLIERCDSSQREIRKSCDECYGYGDIMVMP